MYILICNLYLCSIKVLSLSLSLSVITLQETHFTFEIDVNYFQLPGYTMVNDFARQNKCGGIEIRNL